ncbi:hypothetical protein JX266_013208 [Neoarthrinium moseri]|nr:hypothetical protein JX266_013208 [Neoarthrinium moseri]
MASQDPDTKETTRSGQLISFQPANFATQPSFPFFTLPTEIRILIYQELLLSPRPIHSNTNGSTSSSAFHVAILRTCRQVYTEARPVLYHQNTVHIEVFGTGHRRPQPLDNSSDDDPIDDIASEDYTSDGLSEDSEMCHLVVCGSGLFGDRYSSQWLDLNNQRPIRLDLERFRKFRIDVQMKRSYEAKYARSSIVKIFNMLRHVPEMDQLHVSLDDSGRQLEHTLKNLGLLRGVRQVTCEGVPPEYVAYLTRKMTSSAPVIDLSLMYEALEMYTEYYPYNDGISDILHETKYAMETGDTEGFIYWREKLVATMELSHAHWKSMVYANDSDEWPEVGSDDPRTP